jgi:dTDP-4-dehydrorhamnose reductase
MRTAAGNDARWGIYHLAAAGEVSWHGYAKHVIAGALQRGASLKAKSEAISPITTAEYPVPAPRPLNSRLNTQKLQTTFALTLPAWQAGVDAILDHIISGKSS